MSSALNSAINRLQQVQQSRETLLEATAVNATTGEVYHGSAAVYQLTQGKYATVTNRARSRAAAEGTVPPTPTAAVLDVSLPADREAIRTSIIARQRAVPSTMPNRKFMHTTATPPPPPPSVSAQNATTTSAPSQQEVSAADEEASAEVECAEALEKEAPFPTKAVLCIICSQLSSLAPPIVFAAIGPYIYGVLLDDLQTAGTVSSIATGLSMGLQVLATPIMAQVMDLYGRRLAAMFASVKAALVTLPLLAAGIVIYQGQKDIPESVKKSAGDLPVTLGLLLEGSDKKLAHAFFAIYWAFTLFVSATAGSQALVAIADVCTSQRHRVTAIGMYAGLANLLAVFAIVGAQLSILYGAIVAVGVGIFSLVFTFFFMPETIRLDRGGGAGGAATTTAKSGEGVTAVAINDADVHRASHITKRTAIFPSQINRSAASSALRRRDIDGGSSTASTYNTEGAQPSDASVAKIQPDESRRLHICVSPFKGFALIKESKASVIALAVLFACLMAEISASDTLVFYLTLTLDFSPQDVSYLQIEQSALSLIVCAVIAPFLQSKWIGLSCARQCMLCALCIAAALAVLSFAKTKVLIFALFVPLIAFGSIMVPSVAGIITRSATTPEQVSLSMGTVMAIVAVLQAAGSFLAALVFKMLPQDKLWVTFIISAAFTVPMFILSIALEKVCLAEEKEESQHEESGGASKTRDDGSLLSAAH